MKLKQFMSIFICLLICVLPVGALIQKTELPPNYDLNTLGVIPPAKNQGSRSTCYAFVIVGVLESRIMQQTGTMYDLSEQQLIKYYGETQNNANAFYLYANNCPQLESAAPYCPPAAGTVQTADSPVPYTIPGKPGINFQQVPTSDLRGMKETIHRDGACYFSFILYADFLEYWNDSNGKTAYVNRSNALPDLSCYELPVSAAMVLRHAVMIIGWRTRRTAAGEVTEWLCRNSWCDDYAACPPDSVPCQKSAVKAGPNKDGTFWIAATGHTHDLGFMMYNPNPVRKCQECCTD